MFVFFSFYNTRLLFARHLGTKNNDNKNNNTDEEAEENQKYHTAGIVLPGVFL